MPGDYLTLIGLGGCCEVGRSCFLLKTPRSAILLDCGMSFTDGAPAVLDVIAPAQLDGIVLTHAHLDHVGYIPALCDHGFRGTILATSETVALAEVLLRDYWGLGPCPNFTLAGLSTALGCCTPLQPHETAPLGNFQVRFLGAGHVMGAVMAEVRYKSICLLYTGDISSSTLLERGCAIHGHGRYDYVICESTYGNTKRKADSSIRLATIIRSCLTEEGCALIPAFAVGRAQEALTAVGKIFRYGTIKTNESENGRPTTPKLHRHRRPVLVVDGMIEEVNQLYLHFRPDDDKLSFIKKRRFTFPRSTAGRQKILNTIGPKIIVSTGGMLEGLSGMYYDALKGDPRNLLIFVGYQAQGTRGRSILDGHGRDGKIQIENISLSAHADIRELTDALSGIETKKLYIVHGETVAAQGMLTASKSFACLNSEILKPLEEQLLYTSVDTPLKPNKNGALNKNDSSVDTEEGEFLSVPVKVEPPHTLLNNKRALRLMLKEIILAVDSYSMPEIEETLRSWNVERLAQFGLNILEDELLIAAEQIKEAALEPLWMHTGFPVLSDGAQFFKDYLLDDAIVTIEDMLLRGPVCICLDSEFLSRFDNLNALESAIKRLACAATCTGAYIKVLDVKAIFEKSDSIYQLISTLGRIVAAGNCMIDFDGELLTKSGNPSDIVEALVVAGQNASGSRGHIRITDAAKLFGRWDSMTEALDAATRVAASGPCELCLDGDFLRMYGSASDVTHALVKSAAACCSSGGCIRAEKLGAWLDGFSSMREAGIAIRNIVGAGAIHFTLDRTFFSRFESIIDAVSALKDIGAAACDSPERTFPPTHERLRTAIKLARKENRSFAETIDDSFKDLVISARARLPAKVEVTEATELLTHFETIGDAVTATQGLVESGPVKLVTDDRFLTRWNTTSECIEALQTIASLGKKSGGTICVKGFSQYLEQLDTNDERSYVLKLVHSAGVVETELDSRYWAVFSSSSDQVAAITPVAHSIDDWHRKHISDSVEGMYQSVVERLKNIGYWPQPQTKPLE